MRRFDEERMMDEMGFIWKLLYITDVFFVGTLAYSYDHMYIFMWGFPYVKRPLNHPFLDGIFLEINHPAVGVTHMTMETPI